MEKIKVCLIGDPNDTELPDKEVDALIHPGSIAMIYEAYCWGTIIALNSGKEFLTRLELNDVKKLFNL